MTNHSATSTASSGNSLLSSDNNTGTSVTITNASGSVKARFIPLGATLTHLWYTCPETNTTRDIVLGFDNDADYVNNPDNPYFGCVVGRVANRIAKGTFQLNNQTYSLAINNGSNHLHGGKIGFSQKTWSILSVTSNSVQFGLFSPHMEEGYPGALNIFVTYTVTDNNDLKISYRAELDDSNDPDVETIINLTNHSYFNLNGTFSSTWAPEMNTILDHHAVFNANEFLQVRDDLIPTGNLVNVKMASWMDFSEQALDKVHWKKAKKIRHGIDSTLPVCARGYDHCLLIDESSNQSVVETTVEEEDCPALPLRPAAKVWSKESGVVLSMATSEPSFQFYTANWLAGTVPVKSSQKERGEDDLVAYPQYGGFCLEAGRYIDAIHSEEFRKDVVLKKGDTYRQETVYSLETILNV